MNKHIADRRHRDVVAGHELWVNWPRTPQKASAPCSPPPASTSTKDSGELVRPVVDSVTAAAAGRPCRRAKDLDAGLSARPVVTACDWRSYVTREKKMVMRDPPLDIARPSSPVPVSGPFPREHVISTPTLRPDGSLITEPGCDGATELILFRPP